MRKSQAAMEFLLNYGWAIFAVLGVVAALYYFDFVSPEMFVSERCTPSLPFGCDGIVGEDGVKLQIRNSGFKDVVVTGLSVTSKALYGDCRADDLYVYIPSGGSGIMYVVDPIGCLVVRGGKKKFDIIIRYKEPDVGFEKLATGEMIADIREQITIGNDGVKGATRGLTGYWKFDDITQNPTITRDISGQGNDATPVNNPYVQSGVYSTALKFDGTNPPSNASGTRHHVSIPHRDLFSSHIGGLPDSPGNLTVSACVFPLGFNTDGQAQTRQPVVSKGASSKYEWALWVCEFPHGSGCDGDNDVQFSFWTCGGGYIAEPHYGDISLNKWQHVAGTYARSDSVRVYLDGKLKGTHENPGVSPQCAPPAPVRIAAMASSWYLNAIVDEVAIYNRTLAPEEIVALAQRCRK